MSTWTVEWSSGGREGVDTRPSVIVVTELQNTRGVTALDQSVEWKRIVQCNGGSYDLKEGTCKCIFFVDVRSAKPFDCLNSLLLNSHKLVSFLYSELKI